VFKVFNHLDGKRDAHGGLGGIATMNFDGEVARAIGDADVGHLVSRFTANVASFDSISARFDATFRREVEVGVAALNENWPAMGAPSDATQDISIAEIAAAQSYLTKKGKLFKAPGLDNVANWMLVWGGHAVARLLHPMLRGTWALGVVPTAWNKALVRYLYKGKGSKLEVSNYRPISLLSTIAKLATVVWLPRVMRILSPALVIEQGCAKQGQGMRMRLPWILP